MKNLKYFLASLLLLAVAGARAAQVEVRTVAELRSALERSKHADILLKADIDLSDFSAAHVAEFELNIPKYEGSFKINWDYQHTLPLFCFTFSGTICGLDSVGGKPVIHRISGLQRPLFWSMNKARVSSVIIADCPVYYNLEEAGVLASTMDGTVIEDVYLSGVQVTSEQDHCCGCLTGSATGCVFRSVVADGCKVRGDGLYAGGLVGRSSGSKFEGCCMSFNTSVWCKGRFLSMRSGLANSADCGGLVGLSSADSFTGCTNMGIVGAEDDGVGGIAGHAVGSTFTDCKNSGCVLHADKDGFNKATKTIMDASARSLVEAEKAYLVTHHISTGYDDIGGICGVSEGGFFTRCTNQGALQASDARAGGIVGHAKDNTFIKDCFNQGTIMGGWSVGGIVGKLSGSHLHSSLSIGDVKKNNRSEICFHAGEDPVAEHMGCLVGDTEGVSITKYLMDDTEGVSTIINNYAKSIKGIGTRNWLKDEQCGYITDDVLASGLVGWWLNGERGAEGPWHQNLHYVRRKGNPLADYDYFPVPDAGHDVLSPAYMGQEVGYFETWMYSCCYWVQNGDDLKKVAYALNHTSAGLPGIIIFTADVDMEYYPDFEPIGTKARPFCGLVLGNGHSVENLQAAGLFGVKSARTEILDLTVEQMAQNVKGMAFDFQPEGIAGAPALSPSQSATPACDLQGRAAKASGTRGLLIQGGKKVLVK